MADVDVVCVDPMQLWAEPLEAWLRVSKVSPERSHRAVLAFGRFSCWVLERGLGAGDVDEDLIDEYVGVEQQRSGSLVPAAAQYLPLVKRFLAAQGVLVLRPPASRSLGGVPRLKGGPLDQVVLDIVEWLKTEGYAPGTIRSVACTAARLSTWMGRRRLASEDLDEALLTRFVASQSRRPHRHPSTRRRIVTVRKYLLAVGLLTPPAPAPESASSAADRFLDQWTEQMRTERELSAGWVSEFRGWVEEFVAGLPVSLDGEICWEGVDVVAVNGYVTGRGQGYALSSRRHLVSAMRGLLDWAFLTGRIEQSMSAGVLRPATIPAPLPRMLRLSRCTR